MKSKPHVILVSETWLDPLLSKSYMLNNYRLEVSSLTESRGKGVAMYIDNSLTYSRRGDLESNAKEFQSIFADIRVSHKTFLIGAVYRSPSFPAIAFLDPLEETLDKVNNEHKPCLIGGDFNFDLLKHSTDDTSSNFVNLLASSGFLPCISLPTCITSQSSTLIDNFFCNDLSLVESSMVLLNDISDHLPICARVNMKTNMQIKSDKSCSKFDFRKTEMLSKNLSLKLSEFHKITNAEDASCLLIGTISKEIETLSIKSVSRRSAPIQPWISYSLLRCINRKNHLHKKFVRSPCEANHLMFKNYRNALNRLIRAAKVQYFKRKINDVKSDAKKLWDVLLTIIRKKKKTENLPTHFQVGSTQINDPDLIAEKFNDFFCNIAPKLDADIPQSNTDPTSYLNNISPSSPFHFQPTSPHEVQCIIASLNNCGAGNDGISTKLLKRISATIAPHLSHLFNLCLSQGIFPANLKNAIIVPIFKSGDPFSFNNYRPISLLPVISKVLENIVYMQLSSFLNTERLIYDNQFGFRQNHSTYMPISILYDQATTALKNKQFCAAIYLDLKKAFDTVNPHILVNKLKHYGIHHKELDFFRSYLSGRSQVTKYNSTISTSSKNVTLGVPQGSIIGPLLFLLYINDIQNSSSTPQFLLFADDTALLYKAPSINELQTSINTSLPDIATWLTSNRLTLNIQKSTYQLFAISNSIPDIHIHINDIPLSRSKATKYLGVTIDEDLKWKCHIKHVENTISRNIGLIRRAQHILDTKYLLLLYNALVLPFLNYCLQIWGNSYTSNLSNLVTAQKKIIRIVDHAGSRAHTSPIFKKHKILKLMDLVKNCHLNIMHNYLTNALPPPIAKNFELYQRNDHRAVRVPQHFVVPFAPTNYRKFSMYVAAPDTWNKVISPNIPNISDIPLNKSFFKLVSKKIFLDRY